jgi:hypothetical protein
MTRPRALAVLSVVIGLSGAAGHAAAQESQRQKEQAPASPRPTNDTSGFDIERYFGNMAEDVAVYDPASPWVYDKTQWRRRVEQMFKIRQFLDINQFHRTDVELGDMRIVTVYREIRRPEGSFTERLHGCITWVYLKRPGSGVVAHVDRDRGDAPIDYAGDETWSLWHDHTSEIPEDFQHQN